MCVVYVDGVMVTMMLLYCEGDVVCDVGAVDEYDVDVDDDVYC